MSNTRIGLCILELHLPGVASLKEKRGILKSMLKRLHNTFNLSAAETDFHDKWQSAEISFAVVTNSNQHANQVLSKAVDWVEEQYPEALIIQQTIELL